MWDPENSNIDKIDQTFERICFSFLFLEDIFFLADLKSGFGKKRMDGIFSEWKKSNFLLNLKSTYLASIVIGRD
jgi:hypothetical protein